MPAYNYEAITKEGVTQKGKIDAGSAKEVREQVKNMGLIPVQVTEAKSKQVRLQIRKSPHLTKPQLAVWTRQIASLISAGLQVDRALQSMMEQGEGDKTQSLIAALLEQVTAGGSLSSSLSAFPDTFDSVYCSAVSAGEKAGKLGSVLTSLADDLEAGQALRAKLIGASLYPAIVSAIAVVIVLFLMVYVLPQVSGAFTSSKRSLPLLTTVMLAVSEFLKGFWPILFMGGVSLLLAFKVAMRNPSARQKVDALMLNAPVAGPLLKQFNAARFAGTLGMLATAGVPILQALESASKTVSNTAMRSEIDQVTSSVAEGAPFGLALAQKKSMPKIVSTFARMGTETGTLGTMLLRVSHQLSTEVQRKALNLAQVLEPLLIVLMGGVVMLIVLAVLMPIIELNSFVK